MVTDMPIGGGDPTRVERIDACLPQTQCTQCGYPRCRDYAQALADGAAQINQCPPGGDTTLAALARLLGTAPRPLDPRFGAHQPRRRALVDEQRCIGCRKCLDACPVDAIVGAQKLMHTVIAADCSGCALCVPPCPVDCIALLPARAPRDRSPWPDYGGAEVARWRRRAEAHFARLAGRRARRAAAATQNRNRAERRAEIRAAVERVRARRASRARSR